MDIQYIGVTIGGECENPVSIEVVKATLMSNIDGDPNSYIEKLIEFGNLADFASYHCFKIVGEFDFNTVYDYINPDYEETMVMTTDGLIHVNRDKIPKVSDAIATVNRILLEALL